VCQVEVSARLKVTARIECSTKKILRTLLNSGAANLFDQLGILVQSLQIQFGKVENM
jgi:hypothetical protein